MKCFLAVAFVLALHCQAGLAQDRLECALPQGDRVIMHGNCERLYGDSETCDTKYQTRYIPADGSASIDLGITELRRTEDSGTPAEMCANFYVRDKTVYLGQAGLNQYRIITDVQPYSLTTITAEPKFTEAVEKYTDQEHRESNLSNIHFRRVGVFGNTLVIEDALTSWHRGHYADAGFYQQPLSYVIQTSSTDQGKSWTPKRITTSARLFVIGKSIVDQPHTAKPAVADIGGKAEASDTTAEQGSVLELHCRLPDRSEFVVYGTLPDESELKIRYGGTFPSTIDIEGISYIPKPGARAVPVQPELALLMAMPTDAAHSQYVCHGAGLANGIPYFGATMLDRGRNRFTSFPYPDKIWFPQKLNRQAFQQMEKNDLRNGVRTALTRRGKTIALELPLMQMTDECDDGGWPWKTDACPVAAVLRSQSQDQGETWSDLTFSRTSWIFTPGKLLGQQPGAANLERPRGNAAKSRRTR